ncbi:hypothetical protein ABT095_21500, partial [Kitasatospora sp. NPDC002227]
PPRPRRRAPRCPPPPRRSRVTALVWAVLANAGWLAGMAVVIALPRAVQPWFLAAVMIPYIAAQLVHGPVCAALVHALAPAELRGRYQATFQYAFGLSNVAGPAVVGLMTVAPVLPWLAGLAGAAAALVLLRRLGTALPRTVQYRPDAGADGVPGERVRSGSGR